jgi:PLP dependent protein
LARRVEHLDPERVSANLAVARERVASACARSGRRPEAVELLAATKYVPVDLLGALAEAGIEIVGENTAQELEVKHERWGERFTFDFIGHLQSRKAKLVLPLARLIHSIDSDSALRQIHRHASAPARLLLEVNVAGEESKQGLAPADVDAFLERGSGYDRVRFEGLMTMPPFTSDPEDVRPHFAALRELAERLEKRWAGRHSFATLSMGTSQDYEVAVEEGATILRLGSVLYE